MVDAKLAERLWLAMAVAMQIAVSVGGLEEGRRAGAQQLQETDGQAAQAGRQADHASVQSARARAELSDAWATKHPGASDAGGSAAAWIRSE
jgi:hypothetical protein